MIKKYNKFVKESFQNRGKGPGNNDLIPKAPKKHTVNRAIPTMDFLRIGKHILTNNIDGFIDSVQNENIFIADRITGEIKKYTIKEVVKEITKQKSEKPNPSTVQGFEGTPAWATKQKIYEAFDEEEELNPRRRSILDLEQELEFGTEEEEEKDEFDFASEENIDGFYGEENDIPAENTRVFQQQSPTDQRKLLYGTEDNPLGLPNQGIPMEMNEKWLAYWDQFNNTQVKLIKEAVVSEDEEQEDEVPIIRGTEDNPIPEKKKTKIESYD